MAMKTVRIRATGASALLQAHPQTSDPLSEFTQAIGALSTKRKKTLADHEELARRKWLGSIYWNAEIGPYLPAENLWRSIIDGGRQSKDGKLIERGLRPLVDMMAIQYSGPRDLISLWAGGKSKWVDRRPAKPPGQGKIVACRPVFPEWVVEGLFGVDDEVLDLHTLRRIADVAGLRCGVGTYRLRFGRYEAEVDELTNEIEAEMAAAMKPILVADMGTRNG